jgi:hypothetical protein
MEKPHDHKGPVPPAGAPSRYLIQTASLYFIISMQDETSDYLLGNDAQVIFNTGRLDLLLRDGAPTAAFQAVDIPDSLPVRIERQAIIWSTPWLHAKPPAPGCSPKVPVSHEGEFTRYLIQTASLYFLGTMQQNTQDCIILTEGLAILNTGRLDDLLQSGVPTTNFAACELPEALPMRIERQSIIWSVPWVHAKPRVPCQ